MYSNKRWTRDNRTANEAYAREVLSYVGFDYVEDQAGGRTPDGVLPADVRCPNGVTLKAGLRCEFKNPKYGLATSSMFCEVGETTDGGDTWRASGVMAQSQHASTFLLTIPGRRVALVPSSALLVLEEEYQGTQRTTRPGANGNAAGRLARGVLVPWERIEEASLALWALPAELDPLAPATRTAS